jgi:hypothetical protein
MDFVRLWDRARARLGYRWRPSRGEQRAYRWDIFLSHAGDDHDEAARLSRWLKSEFHQRGRELSIFNTSEPATRFVPGSLRPEFRGLRDDQLEPSPYLPYLPHRTYSNDPETDLRRYLADNMKASRAYLLLITPRSLDKNSAWVSYEIEAAYALVRERGYCFFPCKAEGVKGADFAKLPWMAAQFMHADIGNDEGLTKLARALRPKVFC